MANYLLRRILLGVVTLTVITFIVYGLARSMPCNPLTVQLGESDPSRKLNAEDQQRMLEIYGLDKPWPVGYMQWIGKVVRGDLGRSLFGSSAGAEGGDTVSFSNGSSIERREQKGLH